MSLREYKQKRDFKRTPEPAGQEAGREGRSYVVQKHQASHLHYDFRLELDGVLKSWAVPKGPSLDPSVKRLALEVEDHPVAYGSFEGNIPEGEYGGGTVMLWDRGEWEPVGDAEEGYRTGKLKFTLHGEKLRGRWMLVRTQREAGKGRKQWLLFKERDDEASKDGDVLEELPLSVATGRDLDDITADRKAVWKSKTKAAPAKSESMPRKIKVQLATLAREAPDGDQWWHEIKFDGYRLIGRIEDGAVTFMTRNFIDWTKRLPSLVETAGHLKVKNAIFDGELVALRRDGTTDFQDLQNAFRDRKAHALYYYVFDLLYLDGKDLTGEPLEVRKKALAKLVGKKGHIRLSEHIEGNGPAFFKEVCKTGLEGIISKRKDRPYRGGRGEDWLKVKCLQNDEFVIGGYSDPEGARTGLGAILVGYHNGDGELVYAGKVGTGFGERMLQSLIKRLRPLERDDSPFSDHKKADKKTHWVEPELVAQVAFGMWTREGILRHASFQGLREDKPASEVTREKAVAVSEANIDDSDYDAKKQELAGVRLTSPDKVLYPEEGITKLELANYYRAVADWILPHVVDRPIVIVRCPEGRDGECFYQKHPGLGTPTNLRLIPIKEKTKMGKYVVVDDVDGLISLAQMGALEIHAWGSRTDRLDRPDRLIFDLDPAEEVDWAQVVRSAGQVREFLHELGLESFVKTTGGKGLHLVVPIDRRHDWDEAKAFCKHVADLIVKADPRHYTANMAKAARTGKIFLDYLRNDRGSTAVVPYSTRARPGAPVSVPLTWKEVHERTRSDKYNIRNLGRRLRSLQNDPWEGFDGLRQSLSGPMKKIEAVMRK